MHKVHNLISPIINIQSTILNLLRSYYIVTNKESDPIIILNPDSVIGIDTNPSTSSEPVLLCVLSKKTIL